MSILGAAPAVLGDQGRSGGMKTTTMTTRKSVSMRMTWMVGKRKAGGRAFWVEATAYRA